VAHAAPLFRIAQGVRGGQHGGKDDEDVKSQGTLTDFQKERISRLLNAIHNHPRHDLNEMTQKILSQSAEEISVLTQMLGVKND
jgi:hypothetical protein